MNYYDDSNAHLNEGMGNDIRSAGLFFFLLIMLEIPVSYLIEYLQGVFPVQKEIIVSIVVSQMYLLCMVFLYIFITKKSLSEDIGIKKCKISSFFLSFFVLVCSFPAAVCINIASQFFVTNRTVGAIFEVTQNLPFWLALIIVGVIPGIVEETIYRGIIFRSFRKYSVIVGIVISSVAFGLMHLDLNQTLYATFMGFVFAFLAEATGSLVSTIILHMLFNVANTCYLYYLPVMFNSLRKYEAYKNIGSIEELLSVTPTNEELLEVLLRFTPMALAGIAVTILTIIRIARINDRDLSWKHLCQKNEEGEGGKPISLWMALGFLFCIFIIINKL